MMYKKMKSQNTIDEIVTHILKHGGPDPERKAHPKKKRVKYDELKEAVYKIHSKGLLLDLREYQFNNVFGIWNTNGKPNKRLGREMFDELVEKLLEKYGNLIKTINNMSKDEILKEGLEIETKNGKIEYALGSMFQNISFDGKHTASPYSILKYWIDTHTDKRIKEEYAGLKPWHLARASREIWQGEEGKKNGRELTDELIQKLVKIHGNLSEALKNIRAEHFEKEQLEYSTSDGTIIYTPNSMFQKVSFDGKHIKSVYGAVKYWMETHSEEGIKYKYSQELSMIKERSEIHRPKKGII